MKKAIGNIIGGLAGAMALNIIHQVVKSIDHDAPRVDLVGEEALSKGILAIGLKPPQGNALFAATLAGDIISNAVYYSGIGLAKKKQLLLTGAVLGAAAGIGAVKLPKPIGLSDAPVTRTDKTKLLTVAWYTLGGLVAASAIKLFRK